MCDHCGCRAFAPIAELTAEHVQILALAWTLSEATRAGRAAPVDDLDALISLLDIHVAKEEDGLYPELLEAEGLSTVTCAELEEEHRDIRRALTGGHFDRPDYYALANHIEVEEMELFSSAMLSFDETDWDLMTEVHLAADEQGRQRRPTAT